MINAGLTIQPFSGSQVWKSPNWEGIKITVNYPTGQNVTDNPPVAGDYLIDQLGRVWEILSLANDSGNNFTCTITCLSEAKSESIAPDLGGTTRGAVSTPGMTGIPVYWSSVLVDAQVARAADNYFLKRDVIDGGVL